MLQDNCTPSLSTNFSTIYSQVLQQRCGVSGSGSSCHGSTGLQGGLGLYDENTAYNELLGMTGRARVLPGDPKCSILLERLDSTDPSYRMPYGQGPLDPGLRCAIQQWIQDGAAKN